MKRKQLLNGQSLLLASCGILALLVAIGNVTVPVEATYGPPIQSIDVTHTMDQMNNILPSPSLQMTTGGVMQSGSFPSCDKLKGSLDFLLVQPQTSSDVFTKTSAYVADLQNGTLLASVKKPSETGVVVTPIAEVAFTSNSDAFVSYDAATGVLRVRNVDGLSQRIKVKIDKGPLAGNIFVVEPGYELVVSTHELTRADLRPADGIMRRGSRFISGKFAAVAQYYLEGALQQSALVTVMEQRQQSDVKARRILTDMSRMAAVLNQVNGTQGFGH